VVISLSLCVYVQARIVEALLGCEVTVVSCGTSHVFAITSDHEVFSWGRGDNGMLCSMLHLVHQLQSIACLSGVC